MNPTHPNTKHGHSRRVSSRSRTYKAWCNMKTRALNPNREEWPRYGGRGIVICQGWVESFGAFLSDMGECPEGLTLERINVNGNYEPSNCRWATQREQSNNKEITRRVTYNGQCLTVGEWATIIGIEWHQLRNRIERWGSQRALSTPYVKLGEIVKIGTCLKCGIEFRSISPKRKYCSSSCSTIYRYRIKTGRPGPDLGKERMR